MTAVSRAPPQTPTLFEWALGDALSTLPPAVRDLHSIAGRAHYAGRAQIEGATHPLARLCAAIAGLPLASNDTAIAIQFDAEATREIWHRDFGGIAMTSQLYRDGVLLGERLGPLRFRFDLSVRDDAIYWRVAGVTVLGLVSLPAAWFSRVTCRESAADGRYLFLVDAALPLIGRIIRYEGWLEPR